MLYRSCLGLLKIGCFHVYCKGLTTFVVFDIFLNISVFPEMPLVCSSNVAGVSCFVLGPWIRYCFYMNVSVNSSV